MGEFNCGCCGTDETGHDTTRHDGLVLGRDGAGLDGLVLGRWMGAVDGTELVG